MAINQNAAFDPKHKYHTNASALLQAEASLMRLGLYETGTANELNFRHALKRRRKSRNLDWLYD